MYETVPIPEELPLTGVCATNGETSPAACKPIRLAGPAAEGAGASYPAAEAPFVEVPPLSPRAAARGPRPDALLGVETLPVPPETGDLSSVPDAGPCPATLQSTAADDPAPQNARSEPGGSLGPPVVCLVQPGMPECAGPTDSSTVPPLTPSNIASEGERHAAVREGCDGAELKARKESVGSTGDPLPDSAGAH